MPPKDRLAVADPVPRRSKSSSPSRSKKKNGHDASPPPGKGVAVVAPAVKDNDIFLLPSSDYKILAAITVLAVCVRLFKIYQPSSVVFDEVQYVFPRISLSPCLPNKLVVARAC